MMEAEEVTALLVIQIPGRCRQRRQVPTGGAALGVGIRRPEGRWKRSGPARWAFAWKGKLVGGSSACQLYPYASGCR